MFKPVIGLARIAPILLALLFNPKPTLAQIPVQLNLNTAAPATPIPPDFLGLSFETLALLPHADSTPAYFVPGNGPLIQLFHTLGIRSLRIGGNTADTPTIPIPSEPEIDQLFQFAQAADVKVIYTLRLRESSIPKVAEAAKYLMDHYAAQIDCLAIGNEPNVFEHEFSKYAADLRAYTPAVLAAAPNTRLCGPGTNISGTAPWANGYIKEFGQSPQLLWLTQHAYPGGAGGKVPDPGTGIREMLSPEFEQRYQSYFNAFVPAAQAAHIRYRIEETNSFYNGGAKDVSNTAASALWALDYLYFWLTHGSSGVNFHTGDTVAAADHQAPCWYATFWTKPDGTLDVHPIAYAIKVFDLAAHGAILPIETLNAPPTLKIYATRSDDQTIYLTVINKQMDLTQSPVSIEAFLPPHFGEISVLPLTAPDLAATSGVQLGGSVIDNKGEWRGKWQSVPTPTKALGFKLGSASVLLVRIKPEPGSNRSHTEP
jgi:hypothetical protein